jgi:hypothetical protein
MMLCNCEPPYQQPRKNEHDAWYCARCGHWLDPANLLPPSTLNHLAFMAVQPHGQYKHVKAEAFERFVPLLIERIRKLEAEKEVAEDLFIDALVQVPYGTEKSPDEYRILVEAAQPEVMQ